MEDSRDIPTTPSLADVFAALAERARARRKAEEVWMGPPAERPRPALAIMGCLVRLVLFFIVLTALVLGGLYVLLSGSIS